MKLSGRGGILEQTIEQATGSSVAARILSSGIATFAIILIVGSGGAILVSTSGASCGPATQPVGEVSGVPEQWIAAYKGAAERFHLGSRGPAILAAIHKVETNFGTADLPGVKSGVNSYGCCAGPMQFSVPPAFDAWGAFGVDGDGDGDTDVYDDVDAIYAAANLLHGAGAPRDWYGAIFSYNHADWYVAEVERYAKRFGDFAGVVEVTDTECSEGGPSGPANLERAVRVYSPRNYKALPARLNAPGYGGAKVDARIYDDVVWVLETYDLRVTAGAESGHASHGDGAALDMVPAGDLGSQSSWDQTAGRLARDIGWIPSCGASGVLPACPLKPAFRFVGYDGYPSHGSPRTCGGGCPAHIHVSWSNASGGVGALAPKPAEWIMVFPAPEAGS